MDTFLPIYFHQVEAASSKWVVTDTAGKAKVEAALQKGTKPNFIIEEGGQEVNNFTIAPLSKLAKRGNLMTCC